MVFLGQNHPPNQTPPEAMKLLTTLIAILMLSISANAQQASSTHAIALGPAVVTTSHFFSGTAFIATLENTSGFKTHGFAQVEGEDKIGTMVFICKVTASAVVLIPQNLGASEFPLPFKPNEKVVLCPVLDPKNILNDKVEGYRGLCERCNVGFVRSNTPL